MAKVSLLALLAAVIACTLDNRNASGTGTLVISTPGDPNALLPPLVSTVQARQVTDLVYDRLALLGDSLNTIGDRGFVPALAKSWIWSRDSLSIAFHLHPRARWHDGKAVTARDVRFTFKSYRDPVAASSVAPVLTGIDSISVPDSLTAVFWFHARSPEQFYDAAAQMSILPEHIWASIPVTAWRASNEAKHPVGSGRFRFVSWNQGTSVMIAADTSNYRGRPKLDRVVWSIAPDFNTAVARFFGGQTDLFEAIRPENMAEVAKHPDMRVITSSGLDYSFLQFNLRDPRNASRPHPLFGERELRRALTMAVDRGSIVRSVYDSLALPAVGPALRAFPTTDPNMPQIPFDSVAAKRALDSLGWRDSGGTGVRTRGGRQLAFTIVVPSSSKARTRMAVLIQEQLRQVGAKVEIEQVPIAAFVDRSDQRTFDALLAGLHSDPSPSAARGDWTTAGTESGNNRGSYSNPAFDAAVDSALAAYDMPARRALFSRAYRIIIDDAPAIWLAEPKAALGVHRRIRITGLRADAWWQRLADWWIPADERIQRDLLTAAPAIARPADSSRKTP